MRNATVGDDGVIRDSEGQVYDGLGRLVSKRQMLANIPATPVYPLRDPSRPLPQRVAPQLGKLGQFPRRHAVFPLRDPSRPLPQRVAQPLGQFPRRHATFPLRDPSRPLPQRVAQSLGQPTADIAAKLRVMIQNARKPGAGYEVAVKFAVPVQGFTWAERRGDPSRQLYPARLVISPKHYPGNLFRIGTRVSEKPGHAMLVVLEGKDAGMYKDVPIEPGAGPGPALLGGDFLVVPDERFLEVTYAMVEPEPIIPNRPNIADDIVPLNIVGSIDLAGIYISSLPWAKDVVDFQKQWQDAYFVATAAYALVADALDAVSIAYDFDRIGVIAFRIFYRVGFDILKRAKSMLNVLDPQAKETLKGSLNEHAHKAFQAEVDDAWLVQPYWAAMTARALLYTAVTEASEQTMAYELGRAQEDFLEELYHGLMKFRAESLREIAKEMGKPADSPEVLAEYERGLDGVKRAYESTQSLNDQYKKNIAEGFFGIVAGPEDFYAAVGYLHAALRENRESCIRVRKTIAAARKGKPLVECIEGFSGVRRSSGMGDLGVNGPRRPLREAINTAITSGKQAMNAAAEKMQRVLERRPAAYIEFVKTLITDVRTKFIDKWRADPNRQYVARMDATVEEVERAAAESNAARARGTPRETELRRVQREHSLATPHFIMEALNRVEKMLISAQELTNPAVIREVTRRLREEMERAAQAGVPFEPPETRADALLLKALLEGFVVRDPKTGELRSLLEFSRFMFAAPRPKAELTERYLEMFFDLARLISTWKVHEPRRIEEQETEEAYRQRVQTTRDMLFSESTRIQLLEALRMVFALEPKQIVDYTREKVEAINKDLADPAVRADRRARHKREVEKEILETIAKNIVGVRVQKETPTTSTSIMTAEELAVRGVTDLTSLAFPVRATMAGDVAGNREILDRYRELADHLLKEIAGKREERDPFFYQLFRTEEGQKEVKELREAANLAVGEIARIGRLIQEGLLLNIERGNITPDEVLKALRPTPEIIKRLSEAIDKVETRKRVFSARKIWIYAFRLLYYTTGAGLPKMIGEAYKKNKIAAGLLLISGILLWLSWIKALADVVLTRRIHWENLPILNFISLLSGLLGWGARVSDPRVSSPPGVRRPTADAPPGMAPEVKLLIVAAGIGMMFFGKQFFPAMAELFRALNIMLRSALAPFTRKGPGRAVGKPAPGRPINVEKIAAQIDRLREKDAPPEKIEVLLDKLHEAKARGQRVPAGYIDGLLRNLGGITYA